MLRSYTRSINIQEDKSGSLFRQDTKAMCLTKPNRNDVNWFTKNGITYFKSVQSEAEYPNKYYQYILNNPVKAGLVERADKWEFSSARDVLGLRNGSLINRKSSSKYGLNFRKDSSDE